MMLVDDEEEVIQGIRQIIPWKEYDIEITHVAHNGRHALDIILSQPIDLIIADIRMPKMNGLDLLKHINEQKIPVKSILLSGYSDFEYAQQALAYGASYYLLKPCRPKEILKTVLNVLKTVDKTREKQSTNLLQLLLNNADHDIRHEVCQTYDAHPFIGQKTVLLLTYTHKSQPIMEDDLILFSLINMAKEILADKFTYELIRYQNQLVLMCVTDDNSSIELFYNAFKKACSVYLNINLYMGISDTFMDITTLPQYYHQALNALKYALLTEDISSAYYEETTREEQNYPYDLHNAFIESLFKDTLQESQSLFNRYFICLTTDEGNINNTVIHITALFNNVYSLAHTKNLDLQPLHQIAFRSTTLKALSQEINNLIKDIYYRIHHSKSSNLVIIRCLEYIKEHYASEITLETLSDYVYVSSGYLSQLFKQELGINFIDYLHKTRIQQACYLLKDPTLKTYYIAEKVGYINHKYFATKFKKYMNMTPTQYRNNNGMPLEI